MNLIINFFNYCIRRTSRACWTLFKLMIPVSIIIHIIQEINILPYISDILNPIMYIVGLPAEMGLVWLTSLVVNIYGGLLSLFTIYPTLSTPLTTAQMTVLLTMILIAHTFPIELGISKKSGIKIIVMFCIRFGFGIVAGIILSWIYKTIDCLNTITYPPQIFTNETKTFGEWIFNELKNYGIITCIIFSLVCFIHFLEETKIIKWFNKLCLPTLKWLGISEKMLPLTIAGLGMGIAYGGGLIIEESQRADISSKEIFYAMTLMGLFHSIFEDTILMLSMNGHWSGIIVFRIIFALIISRGIIKICNKIDNEQFDKWIMTKTFQKKKQSYYN